MPDRKLSRVDCLMTYIQGHCMRRRGSKTALARYLGVRPHQVSEWLRGVKPNAEHALGMVEWLQKQKPTPTPPAET